MKRFLILLALAFIMATVCSSQTSTKDAKSEKEILVLERELSQALDRKDRGTLESVIADGFTFIHSTGRLETRREYIDNAAAGNLARQQLNVERANEELRIYGGNTAIRYSRNTMRDNTDNSIVYRMRNIAVYVNASGRWQWASGQSTKLPLRPVAKTLNAQIYESYVGKYAIDATRFLTVSTENGVLRAQVTGRPKLELIPRSETEFIRYSDDNDYGNSEIVFAKDESGQISYAVYRSDNKEIWRAKRSR